MSRVVWVVNHYVAERARDGRSSRHEQLARELARHGWHSVLIGASTLHPSGAETFPKGVSRTTADHGTHTVRRLRGHRYVGAITRLADILRFTTGVLRPSGTAGLPAPDAVVGSSFHPFAAWAASRVAKRLGVPFVFEPRDLWPESLVALSRLTERSAVVAALRVVERATVRASAAIVSPLAGAGRYYEALGVDRPFTWVSNGAERERVGPDHEIAKGGNGREFVVTYLGSVGRSNALRAVVDAMSHPALEPVAGRVRLRIVGDGPEIAALRDRAACTPAADRIEFTGRVPQDRARSIGRASDALIANMRDLELYRWGVSFNKLFEYVSLGRPVLCGVNGPVPILDDECAVLVPADDAAALAEGIVRLVEMTSAERARLAARATERLRADFTYDVLAARYAAALDQIVPPHHPVEHEEHHESPHQVEEENVA